MEILIKNQDFLLYLGFIMVITGILKEKGYLTDVFSLLLKTVKSKKIVLFLISLFGGVLPIPGRVAVSAGILDTIAPKDKKGRENYGIIDYLSTHHYYIWSPLEKTVIIPMAILGVTYGELINMLYPLLIISLLVICGFIYKFEDGNIEIPKIHKINYKNVYLIFLPFILTLVLSGLTDRYLPLFCGFTLYLVSYSNSWGKLLKHVNWKLVISVGVVIVFSNIISQYNEQIKTYLEGITTTYNIFLVGGLCFLSSFLLGSSGKYAGIVSIVSSIVGIEYFIFLFTMCYSGYLLSPTHKCVYIGQQYFGTPIKKYISSISVWTIIMIVYSVLDLTFKLK
jgi:hypothetical protein